MTEEFKTKGILSRYKRTLRLRKEYLEEKFKQRPDSRFFQEEIEALTYVISKIEEEQKQRHAERRAMLGLAPLEEDT